eukprot:197544-Pleurochrysis_carterae.AAC.2
MQVIEHFPQPACFLPSLPSTQRMSPTRAVPESRRPGTAKRWPSWTQGSLQYLFAFLPRKPPFHFGQGGSSPCCEISPARH